MILEKICCLLKAMDSIISNDVFASKYGDLVAVGGARVVTTTVNEMEF